MDHAARVILQVPNLDARYWAYDAAAVGIPTGHKPQVDALIVFQRLTISEMNSPLPYRRGCRA